jgi:hypothetical protein
MQTTAHRRFGSRLLSQVMGRRDAIEWEELPSFADSLSSRLIVRGTRPTEEHPGSGTTAWLQTLSSELDFTPPSEPFSEPLKGLHTREVHEPDIFRLFFGR